MGEDFTKFKEFINDVKFTFDPEMDINKVEEELKKQIPEQTLPNQFYYIANNHTKEIVYVSDNITELTGYSAEEWTYANMLDLIHPDDRVFVDGALYVCFKISMSSQFNRPISDAIVINYRIKHKEGHYIHILRNGYCTSVDAENRMIHNTSMCMVITDFKHDNKQSMILKEGNKIVVQLHSDDQSDVNWAVLSKREKEIVELLCDNKTSEEIANELFISKHTVDTHRRKILKKLNIKNTAQLMLEMVQNRK